MSTTPTSKALEGEWNGFVFRLATDEDFPKISDLLRDNFFTSEPLTVLWGTSEEYERDVDMMCRAMLGDNLSFLALDAATNEVAGVRLNFHNARESQPAPPTNQNAKRITYLLRLLNEKSQLFDTYKIEEFANLFTTCVHKNYRQRGLVTEIYRRTIALTRERGYFLAMATFTNPFSRAGAAKVGFQELARIPLKGLKDEDGEELAPGASDDFCITQAVYIL
ncbi:unnamed protein product [Allacma fusca]|uniref:N-acetyltransferase domain-containing protein n=1 Tax=Allacma fusca TaxID=39272 RepID=A0A8J2K620_9HEXA|nr:unnamed protein product [Allacma fusca]